jgi:hypothetical protein
MSDYAWIGPVLQAIGGLAGEGLAGQDDAAARAMLERILADYEGLQLPDVGPELLGPSALGGVTADPELVAAQRLALAQLGGYTEDGITAADRAQMARTGNWAARQASRNQASIRDQMAARGMQNSGAAYALQQQAGQDASERSAQAALDMNAQGMRQRLAALGQTGEMAGRMRSQDVEERSRAAAARDEIQRYNASARERAPLNRWGMQMDVLRGKAGALSALSGNRSASADSTRQLWGGIGEAGSEAVRGFSGYGQPQLTQAQKDALQIEELRRRGIWK